MGKAALDLPDPLLAPPEGARTSTDELLSQLAGEEIDRLLAEADGLRPEGGPPVAASAPVHIAPPAVPEAEVPEEEPHAVFSAPPAASATALEAAAPVDAPAAARQTEADLDVTAELDALFTAATAKDEEEAAAAEAAAVAVPASRVVDPDAETGAEERAALTTVAAAASQAAAVPAAEPAEDAPLPFYLRPLEWLNAPLAILPPTVRDLIGKAAIVTLLNAAAILAYVMLVRRG
jgi:hypothetical protein